MIHLTTFLNERPIHSPDSESLNEHLTKRMNTWLITASFFLAFCFAHATFFEVVAPFFIPFWMIVRVYFQRYQTPTFIGGLLGTLFLGFGQVIIVLLELLLVEALLRFKYIKLSPYVALTIAIGTVQVIWQVVAYSGFPPLLILFYVMNECFFALIMLFFMNQFFVPLPELKNYEWSKEKVVAMIVVLAGMITGMQSLSFYYFSLPIIFVQLLICIVAAVSTVGATVIFSLSLGLLTGIANLSFTTMAILYATTGLIASVMQVAGRFGVAFFSLVPSVFFFFYDATLPLDSVYFISVIVAVLLFLFIPPAWIQSAQNYYQKHATTAIVIQNNEATTKHLKQFQQFVVFMKSLVFERFTQEVQLVEKKEDFIICSSCFRYEQCFGTKGEMESTIEDWQMARRSTKPLEWIRADEQIKLKCIKSKKLLEELESALHKEQMERQFYHGKKMIALQLRDLSNHLEQLLDERQHELEQSEKEDYVQQFLKQHHIHCFHLQWIKNEIGSRELVCSIADEREGHSVIRQVEELLFELLHEPMQGVEIDQQEQPFFYRQLRFRSAIRYQLEYDIYKHSQSQQHVSGDSYRIFPLHSGLMAIMLSDGMGTNDLAKRESDRLIQMMQECLTHNMDPETAMHTMHYVLSLKNDSDMYATIDFALVDLQLGDLWCWKAGSMTTYVLRGSELFKIESKSAPIGFLPDFSVDTEMISLLSEDIIVMISDGLFASHENWAIQEQYFLQLIRQGMKKGVSIQVVLYDVMAQFKERYPINDDCTVMLFSLQHVTTPWSVFRPTYQ